MPVSVKALLAAAFSGCGVGLSYSSAPALIWMSGFLMALAAALVIIIAVDDLG